MRSPTGHETVVPLLLDLVGQDTPLRWRAHTCGGEWHGPCPRCGGKDRMRVQPYAVPRPRCSCRQCHGNRWLDAIGYLMWRDGLGFRDACRRLGYDGAAPLAGTAGKPYAPDDSLPPLEPWRHAAARFVDATQRALWSSPLGDRARAYLHGRGLTDATICHAGLGFNAGGRHSPFATWGLPAPPHRAGVWLPRGIVIPWYVDGAIWKITIRRRAGTPKYMTVTGSANALYNVDALQPGRVAVLGEGPFDALAVEQAAGDLVAGVASGTTSARRMRWISRLALCSEVLVALDNEDEQKSDVAQAIAYWLEVLHPRARRWRPYLKDPAQMLEQGMDVRDWMMAGLHG